MAFCRGWGGAQQGMQAGRNSIKQYTAGVGEGLVCTCMPVQARWQQQQLVWDPYSIGQAASATDSPPHTLRVAYLRLTYQKKHAPPPNTQFPPTCRLDWRMYGTITGLKHV
jgi:hypothetical protein